MRLKIPDFLALQKGHSNLLKNNFFGSENIYLIFYKKNVLLLFINIE